MEDLTKPPKTDHLLKDAELRQQLASIYSTDKYNVPSDAKALAEVINKRDHYKHSEYFQDLAFNISRDVEDKVKDLVLNRGVSDRSLRSTMNYPLSNTRTITAAT